MLQDIDSNIYMSSKVYVAYVHTYKLGAPTNCLLAFALSANQSPDADPGVTGHTQGAPHVISFDYIHMSPSCTLVFIVFVLIT